MAQRGFWGVRRLGMVAVLALPLGACVVETAPAYQPYGYATPSNTAAGAVTGAAAGGLIGGLASGRHNRGLGIVGGAAAGALIGGLIGNQADRSAEPPPAYAPAPYDGYGYGEPGYEAPLPPPVAEPSYPPPGYGYRY
jgi:hypothetical protein